MPAPKKGESEKDFISRCIPVVIKEGTAEHTKQAAAICYSIYKKSKESNQSMNHKNVVLFQEGGAKGEILGTVFRKEIVRFGKWVNPLFPVESMELDKEWGQKIVDNFNSGLVGRVPVPLDHWDDVDHNAGELIKLEITDRGLVGYLDIRKPEVVSDIQNGLIFDCSISFDWNYVDTKDGKEHGPTLLHVALVNNPYLKGMKPFEKLAADALAFSKKLALPDGSSVIMLSESKVKELSMPKLAKVKNDREFEVKVKVKNEDGQETEQAVAAGAEVEVPEDQVTEVTQQITDAQAPSNGDGDGAGAGAGAGGDGGANNGGSNGAPAGSGDGAGAGNGSGSGNSDELSETKRELARYKLSEKFDKLLQDGKVVPAQKERFLQLSEVQGNIVKFSDGDKSVLEIVTGILEAGPKVVNYSENGSGKGKSKTDLSEDELKGFQAVGADPKKYQEFVEKGLIKPDDEE